MNAAAFVGRLGPLAAALGIGAAVLLGEAGIAGAEVGDTDSAVSATVDRSTSTAGRAVNRGHGPIRPGPARPGAASPRAVASVTATRDVIPDPARLPQPAPRIAMSVVAVTGISPADPDPTPTAPLTMAPVSPNVLAVGRGASLPAPADAMALVVARRGVAAAAAASSAAPQLVSAAAVGANPISAFFGGLAALFNNQTPRLNPTQLSQSPSGVVAGQLGAVDPDSPRLTFTVTGDPVHGSAEVNPDGSWTYTPEPAAAVAGIVDSFRVTVSDAASGFAVHGLAGLLHLLSFGLIGTRGDSSTSTVAITVTATGPANNPPTGTFALTGSSAVTGVVTGMVVASDADGDTLSYGGSATTTKGSVIVNPASGGFTYTPTVAARHRASATTATAADLLDGFAVTISDGQGGTTPVAVTVAVSPANTAPVVGVPIVGDPHPSTGVVTGSVSATDADGDPLVFSAPATTGKGNVSINAGSGAFTYTPTTIARQNAAAPGAAPADLQDSVTVTVVDGHGGTAMATVRVAIAPIDLSNRAPVVGVPIVGDPNPSTGVVTGSVSATDADGDPLVFSAPATTGKGNVSINAGSGAFSYTPTTIARQNAAAPGAAPADLQDSFAVTVVDGRGGTATADVTVAVSPAPSLSGPLAAFPGAEGFGAYATGGRGGSVVYVTNLNADGPGSLQWAIDQPGARYVLFKVSGLIDTQIHLTNGDVTIAGQTSPGGITIRGLVTDETPYQDQTVRAPTDFAENWILQHIRIRPGATGPSDDGLRLRYTRNALVDHVSIGNATDEALEISYSNNITVQNTIIAETVGGHSFYGGVLMNYSNPVHGFALDNVSLHHNVFNRIEGRLPEGSRESAAAANSFMNLELSNNLYWDPRFFIALGVDTAVAGGQPIYWKLNAVNNFFRTANGFQFSMFDDQILNVGRNELFISGNTMSLYPSRSDYQLFYCCNDYPAEASPDATSRRAQARTARHPFPAITYTPTDQLRTVLLNTAGAWPRDPMDIRLMQSVASNTISSAPIATNPANDALLPPFSGVAPAPPADTDSDGMPDTWEIGKGLNPAVANTNARTLSSAGYTDLEVYLQELSASRIGGSAL